MTVKSTESETTPRPEPVPSPDAISSDGQPRSYVVLVSPAYGGAEKRFFDIFRTMRSLGAPVGLIAPSTLTDRLLRDMPGAQDVASAIISVPMERWRSLDFIRGYRRVLRTVPRGSSFHYPMNCLWPLHLGRGDRISMSITNCVLPPVPSLAHRNRFWSWLSFFFAKRVDVLSPAILSQMAGYRMAYKMSLTPGGTFIEAPETIDAPRTPTVVLLSRLVEHKGIDDLLDVLPEVWRRIGRTVPQGFSFRIAGYGPLEEHVSGRVAKLAAEGVPIEFIGYAAAPELFPRVCVVLSMQETTNYPSRVVAEALVSGCGVIVRDTGDSRQFGDLPGLLYCRPALDPAELADQLSVLIGRVGPDPSFSSGIRQAALDRFSGRDSVEYFLDMLHLKR